jgi:hypothetical protein
MHRSGKRVCYGIACCSCEIGYFWLKLSEVRDKRPLSSFADLSEEVAPRADTAEKWMDLYRRRESRLREQAGLHHYDWDAKAWVFPNGSEFDTKDDGPLPSIDEPTQEALKQIAKMRKAREQIEEGVDDDDLPIPA